MSGPQPNGATNAANNTSRIPPVVGINFGNSYASIAVLNKDHVPSCIANEDGERQIATALSFHGEEMYIGNQALPQLVKNSKNTITGFRNLLGKTYSQASHVKTTAALITEHNGEIAYTVQVLEPPPAAPSFHPTPKGSHAPTPLQSPPPELAEPQYVSKTLTISEVTSIVIGSLVTSAADFLGQRIQGAVITVPSHFSQEAQEALIKSAEAAGVHVFQLLEDAAAASLAYSSLEHPPTADRTSLVLDLGASSLDLTLLSIKQGLVHEIAASHTPHVGGDAIDDKLVAFFAKEFTKKTKIPLSPSSTDATDLRALTKLHLAVEHTKRTLSASPGAASCSVESLKDGMDFTGTINRLRFDVEMKPIYTQVVDAIKQLLESAEIDAALLDEVILVGGTALLPGLTTQLSTVLHESTEIRSEIDPSQVLSRGAAVQAGLLNSISPNDDLSTAFEANSKASEAQVTTKPIGVVFPADINEINDPTAFLKVISSETPLPARRTVSFAAHLKDGEGPQTLGIEIWEAEETVQVDKIKAEPDPDDDGEDDEPEDIEIRERRIHRQTHLGSLSLQVTGSRSGKKKQQKGGNQATIVLTLVVERDGSVEVTAHQKDSAEPPSVLKIAG